ncbi:PilT domain-containing protein [Enterococcus haemoperoxidus ATCC BAA-382]|uniref:PilT domain-containing protein n=1 Tax=Enterococcus haemoperoxidus ATCC BAA-382 TaxID=1158608 RepID=R2T9B0_9ENTE|nr:PIN/TRAM domain-containing protein [Enterococcus haemoperoxidus]EOH96834.1 PilT domain-containing protein [Enterococcus haemoperoxidus ATCC BAA-382]EOT60123.1 PilT domain-containing protein [Enterococcus haemoperoxidus ATCC BAA-382]OJG51791.1 PilT domain-containing protein [Enterococcus haemoperoxidus]
MQKRVITLLMVVAGASLGISLLPMAWDMAKQADNTWLNNNFTNSLIGALIFFILSLGLAKYIVSAVKKVEAALNEMSLTYLLFGSIGAILGLVIGVIISIPMYNLNIPFVNSVLPILVMIIFGYLGFRMGTTRIDEWRKIFTPKQKKIQVENEGEVLDRRVEDHFHKYKILDTSVIIDGRIYDIAKTGFLEGVILIPNFVLYELQYIADSGDSLKRVRGRRGLDILNALQKEDGISVEMYEGDFEDISEVDSKLIKLAKLLDGVVVTNDYNLNKVSEFQNVPVLNINALANAVKPVVIPGETMNVMVVKAGTERQQGVAYLDDGTMVVVEDGQHYMNEHIQVVVTSALQTAAGRMIFAKPAHSGRGIDESKEEHRANEKS